MCAHSGHSLVPMDKHGLSDPYCVIYENSRQVSEVITASPGPGSEEVEGWEGRVNQKYFVRGCYAAKCNNRRKM